MYKILVATLLLISLISPFGVSAASYSFDYTIGDTSYTPAVGDSDFYLPFDSDCITVEYECSGESAVEFLINDEISVSSILLPEETSAVIHFTKVIRKGDCKLTVTDASDCIKNISFGKVSQPVAYSGPEGWSESDRPQVEYSQYEQAVRTAVIINKNYPIIKVNGANRYVNYDDTKETPYYSDGQTYLPIDTFARAFGYYYEDENDYFLLRSENIEFVFEDGKLLRQDNFGEYTTITNNTLEINGTRYIPVDYYAEATGKTVLIKEDYIIADCHSLASEIASDEIFNFVKQEFEAFDTDREKTTWYVSKDALSDENRLGTFNSPFATIAEACEVADAGDRVIIGSGTYRETLKPKNNGTADNPIIFEAAKGANVVISALEEIGAPEYKENELCVYSADWDLGEGRNQLFCNGEVIAEARHPNSNTSPRYYPEELKLSPLWPTQGNIQVTLDDVADTATSETDLIQEDNYWAGATLVTVHGYGYGVTTAKIDSSESGKLYLGKKSTRLWHKSGGSDAADYYDFGYITNSLNAVDTPGEWYCGDGKLYVYPFDGMRNLEAKVRQLTVDLSESEYVQLVNINTFGGGIKLQDSRMCVMNGGTHKYISHYTYTDDSESGFFDTRDSIKDLYDSDAAVYRGEAGIYISGQNNAIINTRIEHSAWTGIILDGAFNYIVNNRLSECGYMGGKGISLFSSPLEDITMVKGGHAVYNNVVDKTGRASISLSSWTYPLADTNGLVPWVASDIAYNDFLNSNICTRDTGAVYAYGSVLGDEIRELQFHHNLIVNTQVSDGYGAGIYWDNWSQMIECYNNIVLYDNALDQLEDNYLHIASMTKFPETFSYVNEWNNVSAGYSLLGKNGLGIDDYPLGKWFLTGCRSADTVYPNVGTEKVTNVLSASNAVVSQDTVSFDSRDAVHLTGDGAKLCFPDVDFDGAQSVSLIYYQDRYNTGDKLTVTIGDFSKEITLESGASYESTPNELIIPIGNITGIEDIYIECSGYKSAGIQGISIQRECGSINNSYRTQITEDEDNYYIYGYADSNATVIGAILDDNSLICTDKYETGDTGEFSITLGKTDCNGAYTLKLFSWDDLTPLRPSFEYLYTENKYKDAFGKLKFKKADEYPRLISDGTVVSTYGKNEEVLFKNVDFGDRQADAVTVKYGIETSEAGNFNVKVYLDDINSKPILTFSPQDTETRWKRKEVLYNLDTNEKISGKHDVYFVIEGKATQPMHLDFLRFENTKK